MTSTLPHPNWANRVPHCMVQVPAEHPGVFRSAYRGTPHRSRWERQHHRCGQPVAAYDVTDRRRIGYLYGACAHHLPQALDDDDSRDWIFAASFEPVPRDDVVLERELVLLTLR